MSGIEERIRQGLDVEVSASADAMLDAAAAGVRQRRRRRTTGIVVGTVTAVAVVVIAIVAGGANPNRKSQPPPPVQTPEVEVSPALSEWVADLETDGTTLYITSHRCPGIVRGGHCTFAGDYVGAPSIKAFPVVLWRYADTKWERMGRPGVSSYAEMMSLPGGLMFVPHDPQAPERTSGPLRVSLDRGKTWADWQLPTAASQCSSGLPNQCEIAVAGDYVVAASGDTWARRKIDSREWEDISPPVRAPMYDFDELGYGLLALDDGTLIATANQFTPGFGGGFYRVSRDFGSTWSNPRDNPDGGTAQVDTVVGSVAYAACWKVDIVGEGGTGSSSCGYYRSTDLKNWTKVPGPAGREPDQNACTRPPGKTWRFTEDAVRVGDFVYAIASVRYINGHEATRKELSHLDLPHQRRHVLEFSADDCQTWAPMLD